MVKTKMNAAKKKSVIWHNVVNWGHSYFFRELVHQCWAMQLQNLLSVATMENIAAVCEVSVQKDEPPTLDHKFDMPEEVLS